MVDVERFAYISSNGYTTRHFIMKLTVAGSSKFPQFRPKVMSHRTPEGARDLTNRRPSASRQSATGRGSRFDQSAAFCKEIEIQPTRGKEVGVRPLYKQRETDCRHHCALQHVEIAGAQKDNSLSRSCVKAIPRRVESDSLSGNAS